MDKLRRAKSRLKTISSGTSFMFALLAVLVFSLTFAGPAFGGEVKFKKHKTGLYKDVFDDNVYHDLTSYLHLERFVDLLLRRKHRAANVNVYDEVADSTLFQNRHAKNKLSVEELRRGALVNDGPDLSGPLTIIKGKFEGLNPGFFIQDVKGDKYLLKFDHIDSFELRTSAEVVASRFYHAIGYNVPQYTIATFPPDNLVPGPEAKIYDDTGFKKKLTKEGLEEYLLFIPQDASGDFRTSASLILLGENMGSKGFNTRRKDDPNDPVNHKDRRDVRALRVFASWLNNYDVRESNTLTMLQDGVLKYYLIDFNSTLGAGSVSPMFTHEHMIDYGEATKAFLSLGFWKKPWQKRWEDAGKTVSQSPAVGYFDNRDFDPGKFKTQIPYYAFKDLTAADGFWAAKIIMSFSDQDIRAMVEEGRYSDSADAKYIGDVLIERRDLIGKYWFEQTNPLDQFYKDGNSLRFKDLAIEQGFASSGQTRYQVTVFGKKGKKGKKISSAEVSGTEIPLGRWLSEYDRLDLTLRTLRGDKEPSPYVVVSVNAQGVQQIIHED